MMDEMNQPSINALDKEGAETSQVSASEKFKVVSTWLKLLFASNNNAPATRGGDSSVPPLENVDIPVFEINSQTMSVLYNMATKYTHNTSQLQLQIRHITNMAWQYKCEALRMLYLLQSAKLFYLVSNASSSDDGSKHGGKLESLSTLDGIITGLVDLAITLELNNIDSGNYLAAMADLENRSIEQRNIREQLNNEITNITTQSKVMLETFNQIKFCLKQLEDQLSNQLPLTQNRTKNLKYLEGKTTEYEDCIQEQLEAIRTNGIDKDIHHAQLNKLSLDCSILQKQTEPLLTKLISYNKLPPDIGLAQLKIQQAQNILNQLDMQLQKSVNNMQLE